MFNRCTSEMTQIYKKILSSSIIIVLLGLVVNIVGLCKEIYVAHNFGTGDAIDIFTFGLSIPLFFVGVISSAVSAVVVPAYLREKAVENEKSFINETLMIFSVFLLLSVLVSILFVYYLLPFLSQGFDAEKVSRSVWLGIVLSPLILFQSLSAFFDGILNVDKYLYLNNGATLLIPLSTILLLLLINNNNVYILCGGLYLGCFLKLIFQYIFTSKQINKIQLRKLKKSIYLRHHLVIKEYFWILFSSIILGVMPVIAQSYMSALDKGSVASLGYANKLISMGLGILAGVINATIFPHLAKELLKNKESGIVFGKKITFSLMGGVAVFLIPIMCFAEPIVSLLFERGSFDAKSSHNVAGVLEGLLLYVPFYVGGLILAKLVVVLNKSSVFILGNILNVIVFLISCHFFIGMYQAQGVGMALAMVYGVSFFYLLFHVMRKSA